MTDIERIREWLPKSKEHLEEDIKLEKTENVDATPMLEENKLISSSIVWEKAFTDLFFEILDFDLGFNDSKINFTNALLNSGSQYNPQNVYQLLELITNRLERIHIVKRLCNFLGLQNEMDKIIESEMELIYKTPRYNMPRTLDMSNPVAGE